MFPTLEASRTPLFLLFPFLSSKCVFKEKINAFESWELIETGAECLVRRAKCLKIRFENVEIERKWKPNKNYNPEHLKQCGDNMKSVKFSK